MKPNRGYSQSSEDNYETAIEDESYKRTIAILVRIISESYVNQDMTRFKRGSIILHDVLSPYWDKSYEEDLARIEKKEEDAVKKNRKMFRAMLNLMGRRGLLLSMFGSDGI